LATHRVACKAKGLKLEYCRITTVSTSPKYLITKSDQTSFQPAPGMSGTCCFLLTAFLTVRHIISSGWQSASRSAPQARRCYIRASDANRKHMEMSMEKHAPCSPRELAAWSDASEPLPSRKELATTHAVHEKQRYMTLFVDEGRGPAQSSCARR
jgi:hypothetical protein